MDPHPGRARMLGGVDETLGADEIGDRGHRRRQPLVFGVDLDQERKASAEFLQRGDQSGLGQRMWMDATRQLLQLLAKTVELASQALLPPLPTAQEARRQGAAAARSSPVDLARAGGARRRRPPPGAAATRTCSTLACTCAWRSAFATAIRTAAVTASTSSGSSSTAGSWTIAAAGSEASLPTSNTARSEGRPARSIGSPAAST